MLVLGADGPGEEPAPYFFLSYAHTPKNHPKDKDPNVWVERFYRDLCAHVMQLTSLPAGVPAGFLDQQMQPGEGWQERLSQALASCRVFVPLYSPRYFHSEQCGKEWYAFSQRAAYQQAADELAPIFAGEWCPRCGCPCRRRTCRGRRRACSSTTPTSAPTTPTEGLYGLIKLRGLLQGGLREGRVPARAAHRLRSPRELGHSGARPPDKDYRAAPSAFGPPGAARTSCGSRCWPAPRGNLPAGRGTGLLRGETALDWKSYQPKSRRAIQPSTPRTSAHHLDFRGRARAFEDLEADFFLASGTPTASPGGCCWWTAGRSLTTRRAGTAQALRRRRGPPLDQRDDPLEQGRPRRRRPGGGAAESC